MTDKPHTCSATGCRQEIAVGQTFCPRHAREDAQKAIENIVQLIRAGTHQLVIKPVICADRTALAYLVPTQPGEPK